MVNEILRNIFRFVALVLVQVLIVKNIELGRFINPFVYVLFLVILPFETPKWSLLFIGFILGITIDMFYDTPGFHASACVVMAYIRPGILKLFSPRDGYESGTQPTVQYLGVPWFLSYAGILVLAHHFVLFFLEIFRFSEFFSTFFRAIISALSTMVLIVTIQYLFNRKKEQE
ncbi:MAG: rod shape-determining protein MreD [Bacteroidetes bacterium]|nr:rod shape-determining protein MreD [Bacteroidota bacterium]